MRHALNIEERQIFAITPVTPLGAWPLEQLAAEKRHLKAVLAECPPDRSPDVRALTERHRQLEADQARVVGGCNTLADKPSGVARRGPR